MQNYKIIDVLKSLDKKEIRKFGDFVSSPYYNKNRNVIRLFDVLLKFHPNFDNRNLAVEKIFKKVFPKEKYDYHKINNIVSDLYQISEKFLISLNFSKKEFAESKFLMNELRERGLNNLYEQKFNAGEKLLLAKEIQDEEYYFNLYEIYDEHLWYISNVKPNTNFHILQSQFDSFLQYSLIRLLRFYSLMLHEQRQNNVDYKFTIRDELLSILDKSLFNESPSLLIYKNIIYLELRKEREYYINLKNLRDKYLKVLSGRELQLISIHMFGFIAYNINNLGDYSYYQDAFEINRHMIDIGLHSPKTLKYPDFLNIVKIASRAKEFEWVEKFIRDFKICIPEEEKNNTLNFSYGVINYSQDNLKKALEFFSKSNFSNFIFKVQVKILLCKTYYELNMYEQALSMIDSFRHYLLREKMIVDEHKESYYGFLKHLTQLIKIKEDINCKSGGMFAKIESEVTALTSNPFGVRHWLLEKIKAESA